MPSFLSKVFGRKKEDTKEPRRPSSDASLLEGKFEAVPPVTTPTTPRFEVPDVSTADKEKEKDGFTLFRTKSTHTSPVATPDQSVAHGKVFDYHLSLNLPGPKEESTRALGVVFEADPDAQILLPESVIAERKLSPLEAFLLVQACSQAITARGLETLGIMIPHWYSASPSVQRKLISLFIQSLALKSPITTLSPTASSPVSAFESEISTTRSPHDVAAVLRWGLRHLQLDNSIFGKDEQWYNQFLNAEKASEYPPKAFTEKLVPLLPAAHLHLLTATLELFSSLAAHAEANSISGSKLSKMLGLWILSTPRVVEGDDCLTFYAKWEKWGRILEHLFLARIRDEAADHRMPTRLMELVKHYPYAKSTSPGAELAFLPSPRFSTRHYDALFVRIETEMPSTESKKHKNHPLRLIADALKASSRSPSTPDTTGTSTPSSELQLWESLKKHVSLADADSESYAGLSSLFADETIRFLSLIPTSLDMEIKPQQPQPFTLFIPQTKVGRRRSMSLSDRDKALAAVASAHVKAASTSSTSESHGQATSSDPIAIDWSQFSTSGFFSENGSSSGSKLAASLLDNKDVEVTIPRKASARRKLPPALIPLPSSRGKSLDLPAPKEAEPEKVIKQGKSKATKFEIIQLDEAFIDFWSDALLDPISADWPGFVVCKIKSSVSAVNAADNKRIGWLIIEQQFVAPKPLPQSIVATPEQEAVPAARPRPTSPKPSFASDSKSTKKKRFSFFTSLSSSSVSSSSTAKTDGTKGKKKAGKGPKVGEMGEILKEEEEESLSSKTTPKVSSAEVAAVATGAVAVGATAAVAASAADTPKAEERVPTLVEDAENTQLAPSSPADAVSQSSAAIETTPNLVEDAADAQVPLPTETSAPEHVAADSEDKAFGTELVKDQAPSSPAKALEKSEASLTSSHGEEDLVTETTPSVPEAEPAPHVEAIEEVAPVEPEVPTREPTPPPHAIEETIIEEEREEEAIPRAPSPQERLAEEHRLQAEKERIAADEAAQALVAKQQFELAERERLELERLEEERQLQAEAERVAAEEAERARLEKERVEEEERRLQAEKDRIAAEQAAAEQVAAEEAERARLEEERRMQAEKDRIAAEQAEAERVAAEEAERARLESERIEEERRLQAEKDRLAAEQAEAERLAAEAAEEAERARLEEERRLQAERDRIAAEQAEAERVAAEEAERARLEEERRLQAEEDRIAAEQAEAERLAAEAAEEAERARLEEERRLQAENDRLAAEQAAEEAERARLEEERRLQAERDRIAAEQAEAERVAAEEAERARLEEERRLQAEEDRIAAEQAEAERVAAEEAERVRLEKERSEEERRLQAENDRLAAEQAEAERLAAEAAEEAERARLEEERRLQAEKDRLAAEQAEAERVAAEEAERARLEDERRLQAEQDQLAAEQAEAERLAAEEAERARLEEERRLQAEKDRIAAEQAEAERVAAEEAERARLEENRRLQAEQDRIAEPEAPVIPSEPEMMIVNDEPVPVAEAASTEPADIDVPATAAPEWTPITPAPQSDEGLQFDTAAEVIGSGHIEPLREPEATNDAFVELSAVPVVETRPDLVRGETMISHLELTPSPDEVPEDEAADGLLPGGETPGPQVALSIADEVEKAPIGAEDDTPAHVNGNGTNGHELEDADKSA